MQSNEYGEVGALLETDTWKENLPTALTCTNWFTHRLKVLSGHHVMYQGQSHGAARFRAQLRLFCAWQQIMHVGHTHAYIIFNFGSFPCFNVPVLRCLLI
jgi:hypothetical protein